MKTCDPFSGTVLGYIYVPTYSHIMSVKIRTHLIAKFWQSKGVGKDKAIEIATDYVKYN